MFGKATALIISFLNPRNLRNLRLKILQSSDNKFSTIDLAVGGFLFRLLSNACRLNSAL